LQSDIRKIGPALKTLTVPARFNGPPTSGNGGYACGVLAAHVDRPAAISLRRPVPLDEKLEVRAECDGSARAFAAGELIAEAVPAPPLAPWTGPPVSIAAARSTRDRYVAPADGTFDHCFVCGRARADGLGLFTGPVGKDELVASPWTPAAWTADGDGAVAPEFVWAALDCPGYFAVHGGDLTVAFLVRQQAEILSPPRVGVEYVVVARPLERSGRKALAASALLDAEGEVLAHAECLFVVPR
jgi:hypothetical protein